MSAYALGRLIAYLLLLTLFTVVPILYARRLRRTGRSWWWPLAVGAFLTLALVATVVRQAGIQLREVQVLELHPAAAFAEVEGYDLRPATPQMRAEVAAALSRGGGPEEFTAIDVRILGGPAAPDAAVTSMAADPDRMDEDTEQDFLAGFAEGAGVTPEPLQIRGEDVYRVELQRGGVSVEVLMWVWENLFVVVQSGDPALAQDLAEALISAQAD